MGFKLAAASFLLGDDPSPTVIFPRILTGGNTCLAMVFKLVQSAEKTWRRLLGYELIEDVINGVEFKDGLKVVAA